MNIIQFDRTKDKIFILAPSSALGAKNKEILQEGIEILTNQGFSCLYEEQIFTNNSLSYFASSLTERKQQFLTALSLKEVKIIFAFRGGYGAGQLAHCIMQEDNISINGSKTIIGFSDITALHILASNLGISSIHGPVLSSLCNKQKNMLPFLMQILQGQAAKIKLNILHIPNNANIQNEKIIGKIVGGNLEVIRSCIFPGMILDTKDKILILEDVGEDGYKIHRMLFQLHANGLYDKVRAVIFADFTEGDDLVEKTIAEFSKEYLHIPVFTTKGIGHGDINYPFCLNSEATITIKTQEQENIWLTIKSPYELS